MDLIFSNVSYYESVILLQPWVILKLQCVKVIIFTIIIDEHVLHQKSIHKELKKKIPNRILTIVDIVLKQAF